MNFSVQKMTVSLDLPETIRQSDTLHVVFFFFLQLCSIPVVVVIILVLLFIAPLFYHLPKVSWFCRQCTHSVKKCAKVCSIEMPCNCRMFCVFPVFKVMLLVAPSPFLAKLSIYINVQGTPQYLVLALGEGEDVEEKNKE